MPEAPSQDKKDRLKAALRENLKRRKTQARGREATRDAEPSGAVEPGAPLKRRAE